MSKETEMVQCFFNPSHMILRVRYPYHLSKCKKEYQHVKHIVCPYNASHVMVPKAYDDHIRTCDSRPLSALLTPDIDPCQPAMEEAIDSWEEAAWGLEEEPVVPQNKQKNIFIYAPLIGGSKSERRQHRNAGRRQFCEIENARQSGQAQSNDDKKKKKRKSRNTKSNLENVNNAPGNNPIPNNVGNKPLAEQHSTASDSLNLAGLSLRD